MLELVCGLAVDFIGGLVVAKLLHDVFLQLVTLTLDNTMLYFIINTGHC